MLYEETEKKEIERVYAAFADYIRESPYLEWLWSDMGAHHFNPSAQPAYLDDFRGFCLYSRMQFCRDLSFRKADEALCRTRTHPRHCPVFRHRTFMPAVLFLMGRFVWLFFGSISAMLYGVNTLLLTYIPLRLSSYGCLSSVAGLFNFCAYLGAGAAGILLGFFADIAGWESTIAVWLVLCVPGALSVAFGARSRIK